MDNYEDYLMRVLRRTNSGLQDSLIPAHAAKLSRLVEKFETTSSVKNEIEMFKRVSGFSKCAVAMEWLLNRADHPEEDFSPEQFESDILLMNEKLFEAFLNQPFDMPDYNVKEHDDTPVRSVQQDVHMSDDEFLLMGNPSDSVKQQEESVLLTEEKPAESGEWNPTISDSDIFTSMENQMFSDASPALADVIPDDLFQSIQTISQTAVDFSTKMPNERPIAMSVMRVSVKAAIELGQSANNVVVQDFLQTLLALINFADKGGKIKSESFAGIMHDVGDRLTTVSTGKSNGVNLLKNLTAFINDPKELFSKR